MVVMKDEAMMITIEHYKDMRNRCIELPKSGEGVKWRARGLSSREKFEDDRSGN